ncbi:uncharacterized protein LOC131143827 [Malania oleifera]|uniref:uncharacterized protein LOC131143827 n=1 Tax=Malania oleifera TaxID=397392 RepID=UPI0025ADB9A2|nr:uncharacterized protein LOC131143827 [Malania oleifera]
MNLLAFVGEPDLVDVENWVQEIEEIMTMLDCMDEPKVCYIAFKMTKDAKRWWLSMKLLKEQRVEKITPTWERFKELFFNRYFPFSIKKEKIEEFTNQTKGNMTVREYATKFVELSCFTLFLIPNEPREVRKFEKGLRCRIYELVVGFQVQNFSYLVDKAMVLKKSIQGSREPTEQKKRPAPSSFQVEVSQGSGNKVKDAVGLRQETEDQGYPGY